MLFGRKNREPEAAPAQPEGWDQVHIAGQEGNSLEIDPSARLSHVEIAFQCRGGRVRIGSGCSLSGVCIFLLEDGSAVELGRNVTINASPRQVTVLNAVGGRAIRIGDGCLISNSVEMHTSDYHGIYDARGDRVNPDRDIVLGERVWVGMRALILKGSVLAEGCIVGAGAIVSGAFEEARCVLAGVPARVVRRDCRWDYPRRDHLEL